MHEIFRALSSFAETALGSSVVVIVLVAVLLALQAYPTIGGMEWRARLNGIKFGAISIIAMMLPIHGPPTNLSVIPLLLAAPAFGLGAGPIAALVALAGQAQLAIAWNEVALAHIAVPAAIGFLAAWGMGWRGVTRIRTRVNFRLVHAVLLALLSPLATLLPVLPGVQGDPGLVVTAPLPWAEHLLLLQVTTALVGLITSVHCSRQASEYALQEANEQLRNIAANIPGVIYRRALGPHGEPIIRYISDRCRDVFGLPAQALLTSSENLMKIVHPEDIEQLRRVQRSALNIGDKPLVAEFRIIRPDGQTRWIQSRSQVNPFATAVLGEVIGDGVAFDVTEQHEWQEAQKRLAWVAEHDTLTGYLNREAFELALAQRPKPLPDMDEFLILLNLRDSRRVNELFGQAAGDRRIAEAGLRIKAVMPEGCIIGRLGGDEFAVYGITPAGQRAPTELLRQALDRPYAERNQPVPIHADFGSVLASVVGSGVDTLFRSAGAALDEARRAEIPTEVNFTRTFQNERRERNQLDAEIAAAIDQGTFSLSWQPIVSPIDRRVLGHEALARWRARDGGWIPPDIFIPRIEALGLWPAFDEWVLRTACLEAMRRPSSGWLAVNISAGWFALGDLAPLVSRVLKETGLPAERLYLEITERVLIEDFTAARKVILALKALGVSVAIDDFGSTYSSLSYIYALPVDKVKIDKSFIDNVALDLRLQSIVRGLITLFAELGIECVAEGVESQVQMDWLGQFKSIAIQGYLTGRPVLIHGPGTSEVVPKA